MAGKIKREIDNYLSVVHDLASGAQEWVSRPVWIEYATNNACNLRCVMCGVSDGQPIQIMKDEDAAELLDQLLPSASMITPQANSEPVLSNLDLVVEKCREHETFINLITNATLMDGAYVERIVDRLYQVNISCDSHLKEVYEVVRKRGKFPRFEKNVRDILPVLKTNGVRLAFNFVLMADNADHVDGFVDWVADVGGAEFPAEIHVQPMLDNASGCKGRFPEDRFSPKQLGEFLDKAVERALVHGLIFNVDMPPPYTRNVTPQPHAMRGVAADLFGVTLETIRKRYPHFCNMASYYMKIQPNGDVFPCCRAPSELLMGNTHETPVEEIWNGEEYQELRRRMQAGDYPEVCSTCSILVDNPAYRDSR